MRSLIFVVFGLLSLQVFSQDVEVRTDSVIRIGIKNSSPFITLREDFSPEGMSIEFWNQVQESALLDYEFVVYEDLISLRDALISGEVDMSINPITVSEDRMEYLDFSQPYFISGTAIVSVKSNLLLLMLGVIFSFDFLYALSSFLVVIAIVGIIMWILERRRNRSMFHPGVHGIGDGVWWSAVTMTTVGYGDKAPRTKSGRIVGFIWMFVAIVLLSGLTAFITSSLTNATDYTTINSVMELRDYKVATVKGSSTESYLDIFKVNNLGYPSLNEALDAVNDGAVDVAVYDRPILGYYLNQAEYNHLRLSQYNLKQDYYCFTYPKGSPLKDKLDPYVVKVLRSNTWNIKLKATENNH